MRGATTGYPNARMSIGWALLAGALAALGHAPFGLWPLALAGFAGLAYLQSMPLSRGRAALLGWAGGVAYFAVTLHWIVEPFLIDIARHGWMAPFALILLSGGLALFWAVAGYIAAWIGRPRAIVWAVALAGAELARGYVLTGFPWALPAYIWTDTPTRTVASLVGPYGLSLLTLVLTALPFALPHRQLAGSGALILLASLVATGWVGLSGTEAFRGTVRLVQPNVPQSEKWDPEKAYGFVERQIEYTAAPKSGVDFVVWPETAIPYRLDDASPLFPRIASASEGVPVAFGITRIEDGLFHNSLVTIDGTGQPDEIYDKVRLVPFGEYIPLGQLARLIGLQSFAARDGFGFSAGQAVRLIDTPLGRALPLICYEAIFPQHPRGLVQRPDYLLQITNDAWFGTFSGPYQHLQQAQFRAIEQGLPLVRVANTGISAVIDPKGRIVQSLPLGVAGFIDVAMPRAVSPTLYSRTGDWPIGVIVLVTLSALTLRRYRNTVASEPASS